MRSRYCGPGAGAVAVRDWLQEHGVDADRIGAVGLAGSRLIIDDTEATDNWRNRRVEVHTVDFD